MKKNFYIIISFCLIAVAACTLAPRDMGKSYMFTLKPLEISKKETVLSDKSISVALPVASSELDTYRVALLKQGKKWDYYAGVRWAEFLSSLIQDSLTTTLEKSGIFKSVTTDNTAVKTELVLKTEVRDFQAEYTKGYKGPVIKLYLVMHLIRRSDRHVLKSFNLESRTNIKEENLPRIQAGFSASFDSVQNHLVDQIVHFYAQDQ